MNTTQAIQAVEDYVEKAVLYMALELSHKSEAIRQIVRGYTRQAGVRNLDREIAAVARKVARRLAEGRSESVRISAESVAGYLGQPRFFDEVAERTTRPGIATGLAWTPTGGDVLFGAPSK